jgi:hypothetical protein
MSQSLLERYNERIAGVLSCYDRVVITGTLPGVCYAEGMTRFLHANGVRIFDYPQFAMTLRDRVRDRAASLAAEAGVSIEHIGKAHIRKEDVVARVLEQRGDRPGLVHILSAMEACDATSPGTTSRRTRPLCGRTAASACTTISTSRTPGSGWSTCGFPPPPSRGQALGAVPSAILLQWP